MPETKSSQTILSTKNSNKQKIKELFSSRESNELILAFSGAVGCGLDLVIEEASKILNGIDYEIHVVKLSHIISELENKEQLKIKTSTKVDRYLSLQEAGNSLRSKYNNDILAEIATSKIASKRTSKVPDDVDLDAFVPKKTVYIIDQLKHPSEVEFLWQVYGNLFLMIGVLTNYNLRKKNLKNEGIKSSEAELIIDRDRKQDEKHGQQLDKTLLLSDFFIRNNQHAGHISKQLNRLIEIVHGSNGITPTQHEYAMYVAHSAGLKSACLSRQVGASITDSNGNILATGCNDVPSPKGGLYTELDGEKDFRCINLEGGKCFNDSYKNELKESIKDILIEKGKIKKVSADELVELIKSETRLKDLIEFSRSVHAEMDAITSIARNGGQSTKNGYLYTTTFPCHNCARHIVAAGISKVFYIEPYEKSLAINLHDDSIDAETDDSDNDSKKLQIIHFEGVSPRRYLHFFTPNGERKDKNGKAISLPIKTSKKKNFEYLDSYRDLEKKVVSQLSNIGLIDRPN